MATKPSSKQNLLTLNDKFTQARRMTNSIHQDEIDKHPWLLTLHGAPDWGPPPIPRDDGTSRILQFETDRNPRDRWNVAIIRNCIRQILYNQFRPRTQFLFSQAKEIMDEGTAAQLDLEARGENKEAQEVNDGSKIFTSNWEPSRPGLTSSPI